MIAATMGIVIIAAILDLTSKTLWMLEEIRASGEVLENGQYLSGLLSREIRMAGFYGEFAHRSAVDALPSKICQSLSGQSVAQAMPYPLVGIDNAHKDFKLCGGETVLAGTDVILLRTTAVEKQSPKYRLKSQQLYVQSSFDNPEPIVGFGHNPAVFKLLQGGDPAPVRAWQQTVYYVSHDRVLKRRRYLNGKFTRSEPLANGIEDFQIEYLTSPAESSLNCSENYLSAPLTADQWQRIVAIRFYILARSSWQGISHRGKKLDYADKTYEIDSGGYYQLFTVSVPLMNSLAN